MSSGTALASPEGEINPEAPAMAFLVMKVMAAADPSWALTHSGSFKGEAGPSLDLARDS